jgi:hypothetical protein
MMFTTIDDMNIYTFCTTELDKHNREIRMNKRLNETDIADKFE